MKRLKQGHTIGPTYIIYRFSSTSLWKQIAKTTKEEIYYNIFTDRKDNLYTYVETITQINII